MAGRLRRSSTRPGTSISAEDSAAVIGREGGEGPAARQPERMDAAGADVLPALRPEHVPRRRVGRRPRGPVDLQSHRARREPMAPCHEGCRRPTRDPREQAPRRLLHVAHALHDALRRREPLARRQGRRGPRGRRRRARPRCQAGDLPLAGRPVPAADEPQESRGLLRQRQRQGPFRHPDRPRELPDDPSEGASRPRVSAATPTRSTTTTATSSTSSTSC